MSNATVSRGQPLSHLKIATAITASAALIAAPLLFHSSAYALSTTNTETVSSIAPNEIGGSGSEPGYNYDQWHIGNTSDPEVGKDLFHFDSLDGITLLRTTTTRDTQLFKGYHPSSFKSLNGGVALIDFIHETGVEVVSGAVHLQIAGMYDTGGINKWVTFRPNIAHASASGADLNSAAWTSSGEAVNTAISGSATGTYTLDEISDHLGSGNFTLYGVGVVVTAEAVIKSITFGDVTYDFSAPPPPPNATISTTVSSIQTGEPLTIKGTGWNPYWGTAGDIIELYLFKGDLVEYDYSSHEGDFFDEYDYQLVFNFDNDPHFVASDGTFTTEWTVPADFDASELTIYPGMAWGDPILVNITAADEDDTGDGDGDGTEDGDGDGSEDGEDEGTEDEDSSDEGDDEGDETETPASTDPEELTDDKKDDSIANNSGNSGSDIVLNFGPAFANQTVHVWFHSTPTYAGAVTLNSQGVGKVTIPSGLAAGNHSLVVQNSSGALIAWAPITVTAAPTPGRVETATGPDGTSMAAGLAILAALSLAAGGFAARRLSRSEA